MIHVQQLKKTFSSYERGEGFAEAVKALFWRKKKVFNAVKSISFHIDKGEIVGFLGPNGAGKSTTIKMLSGIMHPDSGSVKVLGFIPWKERKKYVKQIGVVFGQKSQLFWDLPAVDAFSLHRSIYSIPEREFNETLEILTVLLNVERVMLRPVRQLSLGERMRCEFVMAMLHNPKVVFLDEPTIGLDVFAKETVRRFIKDINKQFGTTFIVTSHDLEDIEHLCDRVIVINEGKIVFNDIVGKLITKNKKYVTVKYYEPVARSKLQEIKGVKVIDAISPYAYRLSINTSRMHIDEIIKKIRLDTRIEDLDIENPPITEIIKKLYGG